jgi:adenylosuccinate synthase
LDVTDGLAATLCIGIFPVGAEDAAACVPVYEEMPGWTESTVGCKSMDELPANARAYRSIPA